MDYKTPNVYIEEVSLFPPSVVGVATAIPAFIGYTEQAVDSDGNDLTNLPTKISSFKEYVSLFGEAPATAFEIVIDKDGKIDSIAVPDLVFRMYYGMRMFFNNGGKSCYIVSAGKSGGTAPKATDLENSLNSLEKEDEPTLIVFVDRPKDKGDYYGLCNKALTQCATLQDRFTILDVVCESSDPDKDSKVFRGGGLENLKYGAAYYPDLQTSLNYHYTDDSIKLTKKGTKSSEKDEAFSMVSIKTANTELYNLIKTELGKKRVILSPSSSMAGIYAHVDRERGVWKAPANVSVSSVIGPVLKITDAQQENLNVDAVGGKSINAIRSFTGKGTLVWGARTLAGNDNEWRYIPVRRLFIYVEESVKKASAFAVFEPNTAMTWLKVRTMIESFLDNLWKQGAMAGATAEQAYFVHVGLGSTMTAQDILEGRMIVEVGLAAVRPAEFIVLRFSHKLQE